MLVPIQLLNNISYKLYILEALEGIQAPLLLTIELKPYLLGLT